MTYTHNGYHRCPTMEEYTEIEMDWDRGEWWIDPDGGGHEIRVHYCPICGEALRDDEPDGRRHEP